MEKINTPLGECIEEFKRLQSKAEKLTDVIYLDGVIAVLESRLLDEENAIIDFAQSYKSYCFQSDNLPDSARTHFNNMFKND